MPRKELAASIEAARKAGILGSQYFIRQDGKDEPDTKESLGNMVAERLRDQGIVGYSLHGLRNCAYAVSSSEGAHRTK